MHNEDNKNILLVEDEAIIAMMGKKQLEDKGYTVIHTTTGEKAVEIMLNSDSSIDLILMDIDLGSGIDGTQAAKEILEQKDVPIVFLSSHTEPEVVKKIENITSYGYVVKNSGVVVLDASIKMAFRLYKANQLLKEKEKILLYKHEFMSYVLEHNRSAIAVHDKELNYIYVSKRYLETYRVNEENVIGKHHYDVFPDIPQKWRDVHQKALRGEVLSAEDDPFERDDGTIDWTRWECRPWYDFDGSIGGIIIYTEVINDRINAELELKERSNLVSMIMETSPVGITTVDKKGNITYANKRAEEILGLVKDEITSRTYDAPLWNHTDLDGSPLPDEKQPFNIVKNTMSTAYNIHHGITWPDGTVVLLSINASPMKDTQGNFNGMVATIEDVTETKNNEKIIIQQLNEKEMMLKEVHHRIKNNISSIENLLSLQADDTNNVEAKNILKMSISRIQSMRILYVEGHDNSPLFSLQGH